MKRVAGTKYIFVSGGVISGVGKGITAASIGAVIKAKGLKVSMQKCDPYFNVDAGKLNPNEHGETFVTKDGAETDLDLGHYERFLDEELTGDSTLSSGKLYKRLIDGERAGKFGGKTVQMVPHVTGMIQDSFEENAKKFGSDVHIVEIGGTVGDLEGSHFIEAVREFPGRVGRENVFYVHVVFVPYLSTSHEYKTKPAQNALRDLREYGIIPDMVSARIDAPTDDAPVISKKLATFCGIAEDAVVVMPNAGSVYEVPLQLVKAGVLGPLDRFVNHGAPDMSAWEELRKRIVTKRRREVTVGLVAKYIDNSDTYLSTTEALKAAAWEVGVGLKIKWIEALKAGAKDFAKVDGLLVPSGSGSRGVKGMIAAADYALENDKPYLGICLGLQVAAIAACRRAGLKAADSEEFGANEGSHNNVIYQVGGKTRLGDYKAKLTKGSRVAEIYGGLEVVERHRHSYEVNRRFVDLMNSQGVEVSGFSPDGMWVEYLEAPKCKYFVATQCNPEYRSRPMRAHPLFREFVRSLL